MAESVPKCVSDVWSTTRRYGVSGGVYWRWARLRLTSRRARRAAPWRTAPAAGRERLANSCISKSLVNFPCGQLHVEAPNRFVRGLGAAFVGRLSASLEGRGRLSTWGRGSRACPRGGHTTSSLTTHSVSDDAPAHEATTHLLRYSTLHCSGSGARTGTPPPAPAPRPRTRPTARAARRRRRRRAAA